MEYINNHYGVLAQPSLGALFGFYSENIQSNTAKPGVTPREYSLVVRTCL